MTLCFHRELTYRSVSWIRLASSGAGLGPTVKRERSSTATTLLHHPLRNMELVVIIIAYLIIMTP